MQDRHYVFNNGGYRLFLYNHRLYYETRSVTQNGGVRDILISVGILNPDDIIRHSSQYDMIPPDAYGKMLEVCMDLRAKRDACINRELLASPVTHYRESPSQVEFVEVFNTDQGPCVKYWAFFIRLQGDNWELVPINLYPRSKRDKRKDPVYKLYPHNRGYYFNRRGKKIFLSDFKPLRA